MAKYISLDAVLAEIEKRKHRNLLNEGAFEEDIDILSFINTLKVKEIDIRNELARHYGDDYNNKEHSIAKHFFEFGLNTSNPLTWEDIKLIWNITDEMDNMPEEEFYKEVLKRFKERKEEKV